MGISQTDSLTNRHLAMFSFVWSCMLKQLSMVTYGLVCKVPYGPVEFCLVLSSPIVSCMVLYDLIHPIMELYGPVYFPVVVFDPIWSFIFL